VAETRVNAMRTTGAGSTSFTSTVMAHVGGANARAVEAVVRNPKKKGYARVKTNLGDLNLELHCDVAPRTCENFIALARAGYYDGVGFHRSVKNFMVQGGDPTGTGRGGQSVWGGTFKDEITHLKHSGRGVVSMANSGAHTNGSQFFVCYKSAAHLDGKHSVFGAVVGGMETLAKMERVPTDADDRPSPSGAIVIESVEVFVDPYEDAAREEAEAAEKKREDEARDERERLEALNPGRWWSNPAGEAARAAGDAPTAKAGGGVGKYISAAPKRSLPEPPTGAAVAKKAKSSGGGYGNFDAW
jgi:peptidyl-prolyl cis-trans isomerase-like protein 2